MVNIIPINLSERNDVKRFINFPFKLYKGCKQWVPPLVSSAVNDFHSGEHPFFKHGEIQLFLAELEGKTVGRIAAMNNHHYNNYLKSSTAFFGYFDTIDNSEVSKALFDAAFEWSQKRDLNKIVGPRGMISTDNTGVLVDGFEHRAAMGLSYNYPYYDSLVMGAGFEKISDNLSGYASADQELPERLIRIASRIKERKGFEIIHFENMNDRDYWIPQVIEILIRAFEGSDGYCPPTQAEMKIAAENLLSIADPRLIKLIRKDGNVIGFIFAYHDVTAGLQRAKGRIWPFGWLYLLLERKRTKWVNVNGVGVLPEFQGKGVNALLYTEMRKSIGQFDFDHVDVVHVGEDNFKSRSDMETMGIRWYKSHRSYQKDI